MLKPLGRLFAVAGLSLLLVSSAGASDEIRVLGSVCLAKYDGTYEMRYLVGNPGGGPVREVTFSELRSIMPAAWERLVVSQDHRWEGVKTVNWGMSDYAKQFKAQFAKLFKKYLNKRRGAKGIPKMKLGNKVVKVTGVDPRSSMDGKNTIYMTADDRFFAGRSGVAAYMVSWWGFGGPVSLIDGKFTSPNKTLEEDGFFRSNHFTLAPAEMGRKVAATFNSDLIAIHEFGHAFGFDHTPYTNDYMSYRTQHVNTKSLKKKKSDVWKLSKERDKIYYDDSYWSQARMMPQDGTVLDLTYMHAPRKSDQELNTNEFHPLVITNLKAHSGKKMELKVYKGDVTVVPPPAKPLFTAKGESRDYLIRMESGFPVVRKYRLSMLNFGKEKYWKKISKWINKEGKSKTINGVTFDKAVQGTIAVTGYLKDDNTQRATVSATVWFVKSQ